MNDSPGNDYNVLVARTVLDVADAALAFVEIVELDSAYGGGRIDFWPLFDDLAKKVEFYKLTLSIPPSCSQESKV